MIVLALVRFMSSNLPWTRLPNPGICFPFFGHLQKFFTKEMVDNPIKGLCDMYRKHQRNGVVWRRNFNMDILWVGDFDTLHYLFNHPQVQSRMNPKLQTSNRLERRWLARERLAREREELFEKLKLKEEQLSTFKSSLAQVLSNWFL